MLWADNEVLKELCYAVHVDIRIPPNLQGTVAPILNVNISFLVQLADGGGRNFAAPQCLCDVLHPAHWDARQIHLNERFLRAALPAAIPLPAACSASLLHFLELILWDALDNFLVQLYNFLGHSLLSPFECLCGNFILPEPASYVFFLLFSICATYCTLSTLSMNIVRETATEIVNNNLIYA